MQDFGLVFGILGAHRQVKSTSEIAKNLSRKIQSGGKSRVEENPVMNDKMGAAVPRRDLFLCLVLGAGALNLRERQFWRGVYYVVFPLT